MLPSLLNRIISKSQNKNQTTFEEYQRKFLRSSLTFDNLEERSLLSADLMTGIMQPSLTSGSESPSTNDQTLVPLSSMTGMVQDTNVSGAGSNAQSLGMTSTTIRSGKWSDPTIWDRVPTKDSNVVINHDVIIDSGVAKRVDIVSGTTTLAGTLHAYGSVVVWSNLVGSEGSILFHVANDRLFVGNTKPGPDPMMPDDHSDTDIGLWGMDGSTVKLTGTEVTPWLNAVPKTTVGTSLGFGGYELTTISNGTLNLERIPTGWKAGDTLLLTSVQGKYTVATLVSINGTTVTYKEQKTNPLDPNFSAGTVVVEGKILSPKVTNLSRRILIASADVKEGDTNHRAHTVFMGDSHAQLTNVEFRNLGPRGKLGRYPVHFHETSSTTGNTVIGSSIWQSVSELGNRFVTLHGTQGIVVQNNVAFRSQGHGFFMEDGTEVGNIIRGNLSVEVAGDEELPVVDSAIAPGAHHFWLRSGNTIEGNIAVGGSGIGLVILPERNPDVSNATAIARNNEFYGLEKYGFWSIGVDSTHIGAIVAFSGQSGVGPSRYPAFATITLENAILLYNGVSASPWAAQIFMNQGRNITIKGGLMVGVTAINSHYESSFTMEGTTVRAKFLMDPTYWEVGGKISRANVQVEELFKKAYPQRRINPGLIQIENMVGKVGTKIYSSTNPLSAAFTHDSAPKVAGFLGTVIPNGVRQISAPAPLSTLAPKSGFLRLPTLPRNTTWSVVPTGSPTGKFLYATVDEKAWSTFNHLGYPEGFPPGTYDVVIKTIDGRTLTYLKVPVVSGQVTDLSKQTSNTTYSSELNWVSGTRITRAFDGSFRLEQTYQVQGKAVTPDFTITYYYSTDPYGKKNVTQLGSQIVAGSSNKSIGDHVIASPWLKIKTSGTYYVFAKIDSTNVVIENEEPNNISPIVMLKI